MINIVVIGSSGHAKCVLDSVELGAQFRVVGLVDDYRARGERIGKYEVLATVGDLPQRIAVHQLTGFIVAIGDNFARAAVTEKIKLLCPGLALVTVTHPKATVAHNATIGAGTVIMAGAVVAPGCTVGSGCIINTAATIDHDSCMKDFSSLAPRAVTGGNCHIDTFAAVGIGAVLSHRVIVGAHSVVGAGAVVLTDVAAFSVAYGCPARRIRARVAGEKYL
jgi:sugar O-acyltransferase (sialic acid O-acetyltransferase NeuD family)